MMIGIACKQQMKLAGGSSLCYLNQYVFTVAKWMPALLKWLCFIAAGSIELTVIISGN